VRRAGSPAGESSKRAARVTARRVVSQSEQKYRRLSSAAQQAPGKTEKSALLWEAILQGERTAVHGADTLLCGARIPETRVRSCSLIFAAMYRGAPLSPFYKK